MRFQDALGRLLYKKACARQLQFKRLSYTQSYYIFRIILEKCDKINENEKEQLTKMKASKDDFLGYVDETAAKL